MIRQAQALALFLTMALTSSLQGTTLLQCLCSGRVVVAGFGKTECPVKRDEAKPHCPHCARKTAPVPDSSLCVDCWRVLDFADGQPQQIATVSEPTAAAPAVLAETADTPLPPRPIAQREPVDHRPPAPPGPPLTILYASLLL